MFEDSLVESSGTLRRRNPWTAAMSFAVQGVIAAVLVLLPLVYTEALPWRQITAIVAAPPPPPPSAPPAPNRLRTVQARTVSDDSVLRVPIRIPTRVAMVHDEETHGADNPAPDWAGVPGGTGSGVPNAVINNLVQNIPAMPKLA